MAFEAMNSAGYLKNRMIVVLNDNGQVSLPTGTPSGLMSRVGYQFTHPSSPPSWSGAAAFVSLPPTSNRIR